METGNASYWPPGWDLERLKNSQATGELDDLTGEQAAALRAGLIADLGEPALTDIVAEIGRRKQNAAAAAAARSQESNGDSAPLETPFMETMRLCEARGPTRWDPCGFVVYKSPEIRDDAAWTACKQRFAQMLDESVAPYRGYSELNELVERMQIEWIEDLGEDADPSCASIARIASRDKKLNYGDPGLWPSSRTPNMHYGLCFYITPASMQSILPSSFSNMAPPGDQGEKMPFEMPFEMLFEMPFVVAVSLHAAHAEEEEPPPSLAW
ncbi:hypothetical protein PG984_007084 [Apiospora sp. TS-2023a]